MDHRNRSQLRPPTNNNKIPHQKQTHTNPKLHSPTTKKQTGPVSPITLTKTSQQTRLQTYPPSNQQLNISHTQSRKRPTSSSLKVTLKNTNQTSPPKLLLS